MNTAIPIPWPMHPAKKSAGTTFGAIFERSPFPVARFNEEGFIIEMNPAFERSLNHSAANMHALQLRDLVCVRDRDKTALLLSDMFASRRDSITIDVAATLTKQAQARLRWTAWRQPGYGRESDHILLIAQPSRDPVAPETSLPQAQRWEAIGRVAGGAVHDFNNLLTGVALYCDLLLSSLDVRDHRRRYASEIRSATLQASGLVSQLLLSGRPNAPVGLVCLNQVVSEMHDMLSRLVGEKIAIDLQLDPELETVNLDRMQAQQILLNLVLNARDALPGGGHITIETRNCRFQSVAGTETLSGLPAFPSVLLLVRDNGHGMSTEVRKHLFEPFFTTKEAGKGTGLGLNTVRSIVTSHQGLIHVESGPGCGTKVMVLFPQSAHSPEPLFPHTLDSDSTTSSETPFQENKKESLL